MGPMSRIFLIIGLAGLLFGTSTPAASALSLMRGAPQVISGTGDSVPTVQPIDEPVIITLTHDGASNFIVKPIGKDGEVGFSWVNEIGPFSGTVYQETADIFAPYNKNNPIIAVEILADGNWTLDIKKLSAAPKQPIGKGSGSGMAVIQFPKGSSGLMRMTLTHDGDSNFIVRPITKSGDAGFSLVNEIGPYTGTVRVPPGTKYLWVDANGAWSYATK